MAKHLIRLTPIEPYFFGGENTFRIGTKAESYYISSLHVPPQSSVLGMLRYVLLEQHGLLCSAGVYPDRTQADRLIGKNGYAVGGDNDLGTISGVSPLLLADPQGALCVPLPFNHRIGCDHYTPMTLDDTPVHTNNGPLRLPKSDQFSAKDFDKFFSEPRYMYLNDGKVLTDSVFKETERVGIDTNKSEEAFFKKNYRYLKEGYSFAVIAEIDAEIHDTVCYMGRERSAFRMEVSPTDVDVTALLKAIEGDGVYYALSDVPLLSPLEYTAFAIVRNGAIRLLTTSYREDRLHIHPHEKLHNTIKAGSVFYADPQINTDPYGFGNIVRLGGAS